MPLHRLIIATMLTSGLISCATPFPTALLGDPAPGVAAERVIELRPGVRHVNVEGGEIIRFVSKGESFTWHFNVARTVQSFDLNAVFPPGFLPGVVTAYVSPDPKYLSMPE